MELSSYTQTEIEKIFNLIVQKKQRYILLSGGTGVGKSMYAKRLAEKITKGKRECIEFFSFAPHVCYENFIYGLSVKGVDGKLNFQTEEQRFLKLCRRAGEQKEPCVAIIDDINRADISGALGEVLSALESQEVGNAVHAGEERVSLPGQLYIIGTMNPLVGKEYLDYAWMRRFLHYPVYSDERHFGFEVDGSDAGDEYRLLIENCWKAAYAYDGEAGIWKKQGAIEYDTKGKINCNGMAFLRQYQWDIYMHVRIMYERYYIDPRDGVKREQYIPGHGIFLTMDQECSYGENLILFHRKLQHVLVPILRRHLDEGVLYKTAELDILAIAGICENRRELCWENLNWKMSADQPGMIRRCIKELTDSANYSGEEMYLWIGCPLTLRRIDRRTRAIYEELNSIGKNNLSKAEIEKKRRLRLQEALKRGRMKAGWLLERKEKYRDIVSRGSSKSKEYPGYTESSVVVVNGYTLCTPAYIVRNGEYDVFDKEYGVRGLLANEIIEELKKIGVQLDERKKQMKEVSQMTKFEIMNKLKIHQMILQGPPGTSKTYGAKYDIIAPELPGYDENKGKEAKKELLKAYMIEDYEKHEKVVGWDMVQFHPSYGYEDFVRGITVSTNDRQEVVYATVNKILGKMCQLAERFEEDEKSKFFLIIDEINRADIATVFGELIYALECRGEEVSIPYGVPKKEKEAGDNNMLNYKLRIPKNLYIIGTMNTADKSIGSIDYAIRRRFLFFDCLPDAGILKSEIKEEALRQPVVNIMNNLGVFIDETHDKSYHAKDLYIGHTYFLVENEEEIKLRLQYQVLPILREYYENGVLSEQEIRHYSRFPELQSYLTGKTEIDVEKIYMELKVGNGA